MMRKIGLGIAFLGVLGAATPSNPFKQPTAPAPATAPAPPVPEVPMDPSTKPAETDAADAKILAAAVATARKARGKKAPAAWQAVLAQDPLHSEALFSLAVLDMGAKDASNATPRLALLAKRSRPDAIEFLIEARRHPAFAPVRGQAAFRTLVGIGTAPATPYERLMAHGGGWEQTGTACDRAEVVMQLVRARTFTLTVTTRCHGDVATLRFRGQWALAAGLDSALTLTFGKAKGTAKPEQDQVVCPIAPAGDEFKVTCAVDEDLVVELLPSRRVAAP